MKVYTRKGDRGETSLFSGERVKKSDIRVDTYGTIDEVNSFLGLAKCEISDSDIVETIFSIQQDLFVLAAELATTGNTKALAKRIGQADVERIEGYIDHFTSEVGQLHGFITPGECVGAARLDVCRTVVRRMERLLTLLTEYEAIRPEIIAFVNRLSDLLFILARVVARREIKQYLKDLVIRQLKEWGRIDFHCQSGKEEMQVDLSLAEVLKATNESVKAAVNIGVPMVIAFVDSGGNLKALQRMDGSLLASIDIAINKAYTALALQMPTHELKPQAEPQQELFGISTTNGGRIVIFGGGYPIYKEGVLCGAVGVSGGSVAEDMTVAQAAVSALARD